MHSVQGDVFFANCREKIKMLSKNNFVRFLIVGALGTIVNIIVFFIFADLLHQDVNIAAIFAFCIAVTQNYILNHTWSFRDVVNSRINKKSYVKYVCVNIFGLLVNLLTLNLILIEFNPSIKTVAQLFGVLSGTVFNFVFSKVFVFNKKT